MINCADDSEISLEKYPVYHKHWVSLQFLNNAAVKKSVHDQNSSGAKLSLIVAKSLSLKILSQLCFNKFESIRPHLFVVHLDQNNNRHGQLQIPNAADYEPIKQLN